jgi:hypothetical protein
MTPPKVQAFGDALIEDARGHIAKALDCLDLPPKGERHAKPAAAARRPR